MSDQTRDLAEQEISHFRAEAATLRQQVAQVEEIESLLDDDTSTPPRLQSGLAERIRMHLAATQRTREALIERAEEAEHAVASLTADLEAERLSLAVYERAMASLTEANRQIVFDRDGWKRDAEALTEERDRLKAWFDTYTIANAGVLERAEQAEAQVRERDEQIAQAREACPAVRMDRFADASLLTLVNEEISQLFRMQSRAEHAEAENTRLRAAIHSAVNTLKDRGVFSLAYALQEATEEQKADADDLPVERGC